MKIVKLYGTLPFPVRGVSQSHVPMNNSGWITLDMLFLPVKYRCCVKTLEQLTSSNCNWEDIIGISPFIFRQDLSFYHLSCERIVDVEIKTEISCLHSAEPGARGRAVRSPALSDVSHLARYLYFMF